MCILPGFIIIEGNADPWIEGEYPSWHEVDISESGREPVLSSLHVTFWRAVNYFPDLTASSWLENVRCLLILFPTPF